MPKSIKELKSIPPNPPRWEPSSDPSTITIPGLDTTASVNDQIDQIDQLITLKLQDIDANFSKMQQVLSNRILPSFKRFAIGTEPVREAAKFWTSFFEQAAQVHIPTSDNLSSMQEPSTAASTSSTITHDDEPSTPESTSASASATPGPSSTTFNLNHTPSESSFLPAQAAVSSTPAAARARAQAATAAASNNSTFFTSQQSITTTADAPASASASWSALVESPLVRLDRELREFTRPTDPEPTSITTSITTSMPTPKRTTPLPATRVVHDDYEDDSTIPAGGTMSPPVTVPFARLPMLGRSPAKSAATHIRHALLRSALRDASSSGVGASGSASGSSAIAPTPPSLSRYNMTRGATGAGSSASLASLQEDPEFDSLMRRVSLLPQSRTAAAADVSVTSSSSSSSSGEDDSVHNTAHPSAAFLLASRQRGRHDDDDNDDEEDDSLDADPDAATASFEPVHPFARVVAGGADDDSFDSLDGDAPTETVFGARPVKRVSMLPLGT